MTARMTPFLKFLLTGGISALVNIGSRALLSLALPFEVSVLAAYLIGMVVAFMLMRAFVFARSGQAPASEFVRFGIVNAVGLALVWLVSVALAGWLFPAVGFTWHAEFVAHTIGVLSPVVTSYFGHKLFSFRPVNRPNEP
jgi:putative flippase GtrA